MKHGFYSRIAMENIQKNRRLYIPRILAEAGFGVINHLSPRAIEHHYFRNRNDGLHAFDNIHLLSAVRKEESYHEKNSQL